MARFGHKPVAALNIASMRAVCMRLSRDGSARLRHPLRAETPMKSEDGAGSPSVILHKKLPEEHFVFGVLRAVFIDYLCSSSLVRQPHFFYAPWSRVKRQKPSRNRLAPRKRVSPSLRRHSLRPARRHFPVARCRRRRASRESPVRARPRLEANALRAFIVGAARPLNPRAGASARAGSAPSRPPAHGERRAPRDRRIPRA